MLDNNTNIIDLTKYDVEVECYDRHYRCIKFTRISDSDMNDMYGCLIGNIQLYKDCNKTYKKRTKFLKDMVFHFKTISYYLENLTIFDFVIGGNGVDDNFVVFKAYCDMKNSKELTKSDIRILKIDKVLNDIC